MFFYIHILLANCSTVELYMPNIYLRQFDWTQGISHALVISLIEHCKTAPTKSYLVKHTFTRAFWWDDTTSHHIHANHMRHIMYPPACHPSYIPLYLRYIHTRIQNLDLLLLGIPFPPRSHPPIIVLVDELAPYAEDDDPEDVGTQAAQSREMTRLIHR